MQPDMVLWLGDNPPHNVYEQKKETQLEYFKFVSHLFKKGYNGKVYAVLGNHESYPVGQLDIYHNSQQWLTGGYAEELATWYTPEGTIICGKHAW